MAKERVGVVGASGYSGSVAARIVATHPRLTLAFATSDKLAGQPLGPRLGVRVDEGLCFVPNGAVLEHADGCDTVLLATAAEVSMHLVPALAGKGRKIVALSGAFRLSAADYPRW